jgi:hypothetical protein
MENGDMSRTFSRIQDLAKSLTSTPEDERVSVYKTIDPLLLSLEGELLRSPDALASGKLDELKVHLIALARLDEPDGYTDDEHYAWALNILQELRDSEAFGAFMPA